MSCDAVDVMCVDVMYVDLSSSLCRLFVAVADVVDVDVVIAVIAVIVVVVAVIPWNIIRYNFLL
jgi:hypothetical protein